MSAAKEVKEILKALEKQGWRIERGSKHHKAYPPDENMPMVTISTTPSGRSWKRKTIAWLRRSGAEL